MLSPARAIAYAIHSLQINIFTEEVVFRLNITCKAIFILSYLYRLLKPLSRYQ